MKLLLIVLGVLVLMGCSKKGCSDPNALNYYGKTPQKEGECIYLEDNGVAPIILFQPQFSIDYDPVDTVYFRKVPNASVDYIVSGKIKIGQNVVIDPGVTFLFRDYSKFTFLGDVVAKGNEANPIKFLPANSHWFGIDVQVSLYNTNLIVDLDYVQMENIVNSSGAISSTGINISDGSSFGAGTLNFTNSKMVGNSLLDCGINNDFNQSVNIEGSTFEKVSTPTC